VPFWQLLTVAVLCVPWQRKSPACTLQVWLVEQMAHNMAGLWLEGPDLCVEGTPAHNPLFTPPPSVHEQQAQLRCGPKGQEHEADEGRPQQGAHTSPAGRHAVEQAPHNQAHHNHLQQQHQQDSASTTHDSNLQHPSQHSADSCAEKVLRGSLRYNPCCVDKGTVGMLLQLHHATTAATMLRQLQQCRKSCNNAETAVHTCSSLNTMNALLRKKKIHCRFIASVRASFTPRA
jgi:hypothetical protein